MRVIAGTLKGRRLKTPTWEGLRPTSDKLRETLFNILAPRVADARVLDAFAGTGALGIEAISRGARAVAFIEHDERALALINENLAHCGIESGYTVLRVPVARGLEALRADPAFLPFDVVLLDPPYYSSTDAVLTGLEAVLARDGVLVLEHARKRHAPEIFGRLVRRREVRSGDSVLTFYGLEARG
jgi:16S rRNA (guanine(966)-N(2))-methyltransferase RsmD